MVVRGPHCRCVGRRRRGADRDRLLAARRCPTRARAVCQHSSAARLCGIRIVATAHHGARRGDVRDRRRDSASAGGSRPPSIRVIDGRARDRHRHRLHRGGTGQTRLPHELSGAADPDRIPERHRDQHHRRAAWPPVWLPAEVGRLLCRDRRLPLEAGADTLADAGNRPRDLCPAASAQTCRATGAGAARRCRAGHRAGRPPGSRSTGRFAARRHSRGPAAAVSSGHPTVRHDAAGARCAGPRAHQLQQRDGDGSRLRPEEPLRHRLEPGVHRAGRRRHRGRAAPGIRDQRRRFTDGRQRFGRRQEPADRRRCGGPAGRRPPLLHGTARTPARHGAGGRARSTRRSGSSTCRTCSGCGASARRSSGCRS